MRISVDGGALCSQAKYGTYTFTQNLLQALGQYDNTNQYTIYTFCQLKPSSQGNIQYKNLQPTPLWMNLRLPLEEFIYPKNVFLGLNQVFPAYTKARLIGFSHGVSFLKYPQLYPDSAAKMKKQLSVMVQHAYKIIVSSQRVKDEIVSIFPEAKNRIAVLLFGIPFDTIDTEEQKREKFFLFCGMDHPIKQVEWLVKIFRRFTAQPAHKNYHLYLVGPFVRFNSPSIRVFPGTQRKKLYQQATAYLAPSLYESFNFPVLEALSQHCPVIGLESAIIPEMREFVQTAKNQDEFVQLMTKSVHNNIASRDLQLRKKFSWQGYIKKLVTLYD